jgi:ketosteroid isomerase-like protein
MALSTQTMTREQRRAVVIEYFKRLDKGQDMTELFAEDAELYFPKWGVARGIDEIHRLWSQVGVLYREIRHYTEYLNFVFGEDLIFVEGLSNGVAGDGTPWHGGETHAGRWCDVIEVRDFRIQRLFIYLDPDYAGDDTARYPWLATREPVAA